MEDYHLADFSMMFGAVIACSRDILRGDQTARQPDDPQYFCAIGHSLHGLLIMCRNFDADPSLLTQIDLLSKELIAGTSDVRLPVLQAKLELIIQGIQENLGRCKFMFMPADTANYWNKFDLFGEHFIISFPETATLEMIEAGNCYAARRSTACVFHCMRVAEHGLRILAEIVGAEISDHGQPCPVEYGTWNKVVDSIKNKIKEARNLTDGPIKQESLTFYSAMADHIEYMKDMWRNEVSHSRRLYNRDEALSCIGRVREFCGPLIVHELPKGLERIKAREALDNNQ